MERLPLYYKLSMLLLSQLWTNMDDLASTPYCDATVLLVLRSWIRFLGVKFSMRSLLARRVLILCEQEELKGDAGVV